MHCLWWACSLFNLSSTDTNVISKCLRLHVAQRLGTAPGMLRCRARLTVDVQCLGSWCNNDASLEEAWGQRGEVGADLSAPACLRCCSRTLDLWTRPKAQDQIQPPARSPGVCAFTQAVQRVGAGLLKSPLLLSDASGRPPPLPRPPG